MISFSGIDCSGKSTQIDLLKEEFKKNKINYQIIWSRGGYTPGVEFFKKILGFRRRSKKKDRALVDQSEKKKQSRLLFVFSLIDLWFYYTITLRIKNWFKLVICDRYIWDTYIDFKIKYPTINFENGFWWKLTLKTMLKPKLSFCFFVSAEESLRRSSLKDEPFPEPLEMRKKRVESYIQELNNNRWDCIVNATNGIKEVFNVVVNEIRNKNVGIHI